jgi:hypothetical protein
MSELGVSLSARRKATVGRRGISPQVAAKLQETIGVRDATI